MLNRRILRIKAFKTVYSLAENPGMSLKEAERALDYSLEATRDLYLFLLAVVGPLTQEARSRIEAARSKFHPSEEERNPNLKFAENALAPLLGEDPDFQKLLSRKQLSWEQYDAFLRSLYERLRTREYYQAYMASETRSLKEDAALWVKVFEHEFEDDPDLEAILEDLSIWWNDDLGYALSWCCRSVEALGKGERWSLPPLFLSECSDKPGLESDRAFVTKLLRTAFNGFDRYVSGIAERTPKWDRSRICTTDLALIVCGLAEAEAFPALPARVTINEYVEISKSYSTPESRSFVNGLLDRMIEK
ncbi:MAG: hypothetical protein IJV01_00550 [Bacteroidales bacterium]|nr:hypothetical protein [Bacteroidales bacterium]